MVPILDRGAAPAGTSTSACGRRTFASARTTAEELSHYSSGTSDLEYLFPIGWQELEGIANRGDYDLTQHTEHSGTKLEWIGPDGTRYTPHVIEPAVSHRPDHRSPSSAMRTTRRRSATASVSSFVFIRASRRSRSPSCR